jgi:hypothetical protein
MVLSPLLLFCAIAFQAHDATTRRADAAQSHGDDKSAREALLLDERPRARQRYSEILSELNGADLPEWAGVYTTGTRGAYSVAAAPKSGLTFEYRIDVGGSDRWNHGPIVAASDRRIEVDFVLPLDVLRVWRREREIPAMSRRFVFVPWGDRDYLVPEDQMMDLCNRANDRSEWWIPSAKQYAFPCKLARARPAIDDSEHVAQPEVPSEFSKYLLESEVTTSVVTAEAPRAFASNDTPPSKDYELFVTVDAGRDHKLEAGMLLYSTETQVWGPGVIDDVGATTCRVRFVKCALVGEPLGITKGSKLSSVRPLPSYVRELRELNAHKPR